MASADEGHSSNGPSYIGRMHRGRVSADVGTVKDPVSLIRPTAQRATGPRCLKTGYRFAINGNTRMLPAQS